MTKKRALGIGLAALIEDDMEERIIEQHASGVYHLDINLVEPNPDQPRKYFEEESLKELSESIKLYGIIQPLIVIKKDKLYEIIAGERRWRAARMAGLKVVPAIIKDFSLEEILEVSLIENIQRENLNSIEEALAYRKLMDGFNLTQEDIAIKVSKSRPAVANTLRLLNLDERVQKMIVDDLLSNGHARALLSLTDEDNQFDAATEIVGKKLNVRDTEKLVKNFGKIKRQMMEKAIDDLEHIYIDVENKLKIILGTKVKINKKKNDMGSIEIDYYSPEELERIIDLIRSIKSK
ncbi:MAG: ParB/RepB/Spo0J family partition protein [Vallitaleaceae bacterium]|jgi:ParB family chromosome partitioning protein|nr:ParB/RepB/Spo0J family partition protein [Vallitaleaceae bacterium]